MRAYQITTLVESFKDAKVKFSNEEDEHTVDVYIDTFKELAKRNIIKGQDKDIGKWIKSGWEEFKNFVDDVKEQHSNRDVKKKRINKSSEYIILVDNDEYTAILPLTERSSCYYGKKTNWCISVVSDDNMFDPYVASGKFPVHIMKGEEIYSLVYSFITQDITEYRDSENKEYSAYMFKEHVVDPQPIINQILKHESKLMKLSESKRLKDAQTAIYYATHKKARFEEGEELIAQNFKYSLVYVVRCLHYMYVPVIDKTLLSDMSELESYEEDGISDAYEVVEKYINEHYKNSELPSYADEDYIMKHFPKFYLKHMSSMGEVINEDTFGKMIEYVSDYFDKLHQGDDVTMLVYDFSGLGRIEVPLHYIMYLHENDHDISGYVDALFEKSDVGKKAVVEYITRYGYFVGFSDQLITKLPNESISFQNVFDIVRDAQNGEYIFTLLKPKQLTPEMLYKLSKINPRIFKVIGEVPQKLKDYADEEGLDIPSS